MAANIDIPTAADNTVNITLDQGSSLELVLTVQDNSEQPIDLTDLDCRFQVRRTFGATSTLINGTLANGKLTKTDATNGILTLALAPADTSAIRFNEVEDDTLECVWDLELQDLDGKVYKPARGTFTLNREVTR